MKFLTDMGGPIVMVSLDMEGGEEISKGEQTITIGRYGVWEIASGQARAQCIDTGDDLEELQREHGPGLKMTKVTNLTARVRE